MTVLETLIPGMPEAASAVARLLPTSSPLAPSNLIDGPDARTAAEPGPGSRAVSARLSGGVTGAVALLVSGEVATAIENGPVGPQGLVAGVETALADAVARLSAAAGSEVRFDSAQELPGELVVASDVELTAVGVQLTDGEAHLATFLLFLDENAPVVPQSVEFEALAPHATAHGNRSLDLLHDVEMGVAVELGRTRLNVRELLNLVPGSVVELDRAAGSPVDLLVNGTLIARGEVVVIDEEFGVRISEIVGQENNGPR